MIKRFVIAIVLLGLVAGGVVGFNTFRDQAIQDFFANRPVPALPVDTVVAEAGEWVPALEAIGTIYARRGIELAVEGGGVIREMNFSANDEVDQGQVLVRIADEVEQADLASARTSVRLAEQQLGRISSLGDRGIASEATIDEAQAALATAQAQVRRIGALIDQKVLVAPFAGVIGIPQVEEGQFVTAGTEIATLQDLETLRADFSVPEQSLPLIEIGRPVGITAETGARATGFITAIEPRVEPTTRLVAVRAEIDSEDGILSPGQFVRVRVALPAEENVVVLPQTAVVTSLYGDYVFAVAPAEDGERLVARQVFVETGTRQEGRVEIVSGVAAGDRIVIAGQNRLSNGAPVDPGDAQEAPSDPAVAAPEESEEVTSEDLPAGAAQASEASE